MNPASSTAPPPPTTTPLTGTTTTGTPAPDLILRAYTEIRDIWTTVRSQLASGQHLLALDLLSRTTDAVATNAERLGLVSDDPPYNTLPRNELWRDLNSIWLHSLHHLFEVSPTSPEQRITEHHLLHLRNHVIAWSDLLERYGLVDYEMGFWERDVLDQLDAVLKVLGFEVVELAQDSLAPSTAPSAPTAAGSANDAGGVAGGDSVVEESVVDDDGMSHRMEDLQDPEYMAKILGFDPNQDVAAIGNPASGDVGVEPGAHVVDTTKPPPAKRAKT